MSALLFDIGGTNLRSALSTEEGITAIERVRTPANPKDAVSVLSARGPVARAIGGVPSIVRADGSVTEATNLPDWNGFAFDAELEAALSAPVLLRNDAELAALGEAVYGAGKGYDAVAYLGLGTGVGTALVKGGSIVGHTSDGAGRRSVMTLLNGTWAEDCIGGRRLEAEFGIAPRDIPRDVWLARSSMVAQVARNMTDTWRPDVIVVTGSLLNEENGFRLADIIEMAGKTSATIVRGKLKDEAGLWGARALL